MIHNSKNVKTWVEIDKRALMHNLRAAQKQVGSDVVVMCVVKSNAYGHGLQEVAREIATYKPQNAHGRPWFGVDSVEEALMLKKAGIKNNILILGHIPKPRLADAIQNSFRFSLYDTGALKESAHIAKQFNKKALVHIKLESGTYRQGIVTDDVSSFVRMLKKHPEVLPEGIYTHFADSEDTSSGYYKEQYARFIRNAVLFQRAGIRPRYRHTASSAALYMYPETHENMVRLGIGLYGLYPSEDVQHSLGAGSAKAPGAWPLKPALTWKTRIIQIKAVPRGATVGYSRTFTARRPTKLAILPVGYWDGYDRRFSNLGAVLIKGKRAPVAGTICMNIMMVDVTDIRGAAAGGEVVLIGRQGPVEITAEEFAGAIGTINYEVVTRINPLIPRIIV